MGCREQQRCWHHSLRGEIELKVTLVFKKSPQFKVGGHIFVEASVLPRCTIDPECGLDVKKFVRPTVLEELDQQRKHL